MEKGDNGENYGSHLWKAIRKDGLEFFSKTCLSICNGAKI